MWLSFLSNPVSGAPDGLEPDADPRSGAGRDAATLAMWLFLAALAALFAPLLIAYVIYRAEADAWPPPGLPDLPRAMWLSTLILIATSGVMHRALRSVRHDGLLAMRRSLVAAAVLGVGFLACQSYCWSRLLEHTLPHTLWRYAGLFYFFTVLHALHIIGGVAWLGIVTRNGYRGRYSRIRYVGVQNCALYWHFLGVVWAVMFGAMLVP